MHTSVVYVKLYIYYFSSCGAENPLSVPEWECWSSLTAHHSLGCLQNGLMTSTHMRHPKHTQPILLHLLLDPPYGWPSHISCCKVSPPAQKLPLWYGCVNTKSGKSLTKLSTHFPVPFLCENGLGDWLESWMCECLIFYATERPEEGK